MNNFSLTIDNNQSQTNVEQRDHCPLCHPAFRIERLSTPIMLAPYLHNRNKHFLREPYRLLAPLSPPPPPFLPHNPIPLSSATNRRSPVSRVHHYPQTNPLISRGEIFSALFPGLAPELVIHYSTLPALMMDSLLQTRQESREIAISTLPGRPSCD
ncbi:hypothetical protein RRG08_067097 [Elysia crispata]|uniref:Uncharacterized protein n=1 Tax=Elysia crispata TaxID=231223 RepID=A0AAE1B7L2_9GAST|nr:hypothetical protein RRG08_067097 [Elysia crispata]